MAGRERELTQRYAEAWPGFESLLERVMRIERVTDGDALVRIHRSLLDSPDPAPGYVVSLPP